MQCATQQTITQEQKPATKTYYLYLKLNYAMFSNFLKIALRNLWKNKVLSFINIFGLASGMACSVLIFLFVIDELSYDRFNKDADRIYRVVKDIFRQVCREPTKHQLRI